MRTRQRVARPLVVEASLARTVFSYLPVTRLSPHWMQRASLRETKALQPGQLVWAWRSPPAGAGDSPFAAAGFGGAAFPPAPVAGRAAGALDPGTGALAGGGAFPGASALLRL